MFEDNKSTVIPKWSISNSKGLSTLSQSESQKGKFSLMFIATNCQHQLITSSCDLAQFYSFVLLLKLITGYQTKSSRYVTWVFALSQCEPALNSLFLQGRSSWDEWWFCVLYLRIRRVPQRRGACRLRTGGSGSCSLDSCRYCTWRWDSVVWRSRSSVCSSHCKYFARSRTETTNPTKNLDVFCREKHAQNCAEKLYIVTRLL